MQSDPNTMDLNHQDKTSPNQYLATDRAQFGVDNNYQSVRKPPSPPPSYSQPSVSNTGYVAPGVYYHGQTSLYPQARVVIMPMYHPFGMNKVLTTITPDLRIFFIATSIIYVIWSLVAMSLEIVLAINSRSVLYPGFWAGSVLLGGGICLLIIAFRACYWMVYLIRFFIFVLFFCILGFILCTIYYATATKCSSIFSNQYSCDKELVSTLKITILILFMLAIFHTIAVLIVINKVHKKSLIMSITTQMASR